MQNSHTLFKKLLHTPFPFRQGKLSLLIILLLSAVLYLTALAHPVAASPDPRSGFSSLPLKYGRVIYRVNENSPKQLYIIGISHRSAETGQNGSNTIKTQADIFRIGEWLKQNRELQLLLPEGYFTASKNYCPPTVLGLPAGLVDNTLLEKKLADESRFVNAEMLLKENCQMHVSQVEDRDLYDAVYGSLLSLQSTGPSQSPQERLARLQYLQELRAAELLQKIPEIIDSELNGGHIKSRSAMFTIGLNHIQDFVRYLQGNEINIENLQSEVNLLKIGYGVTIIIPRTLADDRKLLQLTNLEQILLASGP